MVEIILSLSQSLLPERGGGGVNQKNYSQKGFAAERQMFGPAAAKN
jgi:hypothetical protein